MESPTKGVMNNRRFTVSETKDICVICAYRENCQKRFSLKAGQKCLDFARDLLIKDKGNQEEDKAVKK